MRRTKKKTTAKLKVSDFNQDMVKIGGQEVVDELRQTWSRMDIGYGGLEWEKSEGVIINLLNQGLSQKEIKSFFVYWRLSIDRLKKAIDSKFLKFHIEKKTGEIQRNY